MRRTSFRISLAALAFLAACGRAETFRSIHDVPYGAHGEQTTYDAYVPNDGKTNRPGVLYIHGGAWDTGSKETGGPTMEALARAGYVAFSINYRLSPGVTFPALPQDARCAFAHALAHAADYGLDAQRLAVYGYSAGGNLAGLLATAWDEPRFVGDCALGVTAAPAAVITEDSVLDMTDLSSPLVTQYMGGTFEEKPDDYAFASPVDHVRPGLSPWLILHGDQDALVPYRESVHMRDALEQAGDPVQMLTLSGGGHVLTPPVGTGEWALIGPTNDAVSVYAVEKFLEQALGKP